MSDRAVFRPQNYEAVEEYAAEYRKLVPEEPRTAAGRQLCDWVWIANVIRHIHDNLGPQAFAAHLITAIRPHVLAIEAEAAARTTEPDEGLREALDGLRSPRNGLGKLALPKGLMERAVEAAWEEATTPVGDPADGIEMHNLSVLADSIIDHLLAALADRIKSED